MHKPLNLRSGRPKKLAVQGQEHSKKECLWVETRLVGKTKNAKVNPCAQWMVAFEDMRAGLKERKVEQAELDKIYGFRTKFRTNQTEIL